MCSSRDTVDGGEQLALSNLGTRRPLLVRPSQAAPLHTACVQHRAPPGRLPEKNDPGLRLTRQHKQNEFIFTSAATKVDGFH